MTTPTPTQPAETETALARRYRLELDMGTGSTVTWAIVPGINDFAPKVDQTQQPSTTYEDDGWADQTPTEYAWSIEATMLHRCHPDTKAFNPAQLKLRKAAEAFGAGASVHVRWYDREGRDDAYEGRALVQWERDGTATDDLESIKVTLTGKGKRTPIENPLKGTGA
ncbi:phage tail tube protein [Streptomyces sp. NPDC003278]|uniref:phage tail tube protein n=1 Tax=Streptomyces sp. NPDC003278 TaxID=3364679 RepID=UPI0036B1DE94